jgi:hypothetical protein
MAEKAALWLSTRSGGPMTASDSYQMVEWRGAVRGGGEPLINSVTFSRTWLDNGGAEGDLIELNG